jgi:outer membrane immunogenic protein
MGRAIVVLAALSALAFGAPARADSQAPAPPAVAPNPQPPSLPSLALDPQAPPPSIWKGLYVGSDLMVAGVKGSKPMAGGSAYMGYDHYFDNNLVLGVQASAGYAPLMFQPGPFKGFDYALASVRVGYEMGRLTPYLMTGIALAKPDGAPGAGYLSPGDSMNNVFNGSQNLAASGVVGAGFNYALTSNTSVGLAAVVGAGHGFVPPPSP